MVFPSHVSGRGYKFGPVCVSVCPSVSVNAQVFSLTMHFLLVSQTIYKIVIHIYGKTPMVHGRVFSHAICLTFSPYEALVNWTISSLYSQLAGHLKKRVKFPKRIGLHKAMVRIIIYCIIKLPLISLFFRSANRLLCIITGEANYRMVSTRKSVPRTRPHPSSALLYGPSNP